MWHRRFLCHTRWPTITLVFSNSYIHNILTNYACRLDRQVLKLGGTGLIQDFIKTGFYQKVLAEPGCKQLHEDECIESPPLRIVKARK